MRRDVGTCRVIRRQCWLEPSSPAAPALFEAPFSVEAAPGRLPKSVVPLDYDIALVPDLAAHAVRGTEAITLKVRCATPTITFNSLNQVRAGNAARPQPVLLTEDGQTVAAGRCDQSLSLTPDAIGFYRVAYDQGTLETNRLAFSGMPSGDRIALLDDQWALVQSGQQKLARYLALAVAMGTDLRCCARMGIVSCSSRPGSAIAPRPDGVTQLK